MGVQPSTGCRTRLETAPETSPSPAMWNSLPRPGNVACAWLCKPVPFFFTSKPPSVPSCLDDGLSFTLSLLPPVQTILYRATRMILDKLILQPSCLSTSSHYLKMKTSILCKSLLLPPSPSPTVYSFFCHRTFVLAVPSASDTIPFSPFLSGKPTLTLQS